MLTIKYLRTLLVFLFIIALQAPNFATKKPFPSIEAIMALSPEQQQQLINKSQSKSQQQQQQQQQLASNESDISKETDTPQTEITPPLLSRVEQTFLELEAIPTQDTVYIEEKITTQSIKNEYKDILLTDNEIKLLLQKKELDTLKKEKLAKEKKIPPYQYGYDIFKQANDTPFDLNIPVNNDYILGPNDTLIIRIWGKLEESIEVTIDNTGNIYLPKVGKLSLLNTPFGDASSIIKKALEEYYVNLEISVSMGELKTIKVFVLGEASKPGAYNASSLSTLFTVLYAAGGPKKSGSLRNIYLKRGKKKPIKVDLYDYLLNANNKQDPALKAYDTIYIPAIGPTVQIKGAVKTPAIFEIKETTTLESLLKNYAGGFSDQANKNSVNIKRIEKNKRSLYTVQTTQFDSFKLKGGDIISASEISEDFDNFVKITGAVYKPGKLEFTPNMTLANLIHLSNNFRPEANLNHIKIIREFSKEDHQSIFIDATNKELLTLPLQNKDIITVYTNEEINGIQTVHIDGAVQKKGQFKLLKNMKISDLVQLATPLNTADLSHTELYRKNKNEETVFSFNLNHILKNPSSTENIVLSNFDRLFIRYNPNLTRLKQITLSGEVTYPGSYFATYDEPLSSIIKRAGGFTQNAFLKGAVFKRRSVKIREEEGQKRVFKEEKKRLIFDQSKLGTFNDATQQMYQQSIVFLEEKIAESDGRIVINLTPLKTFEESSDNITVENLDSLHIPEKPVAIQVIGGVHHPTAIVFKANKRASYYIEQSGGFTEFAKKGKVYVFKANGSIKQNKTSIERGDTIYVPEKIKVYTPWLKIITNTSQTLFNVLSIMKLSTLL